MKVISIGEVLWDVIGGKEHLGGAPFNFAAHLSRLDHEVYFVSAVGNDERGRRILHSMEDMGLSTRYVHTHNDYGTGVVNVTLDSAKQPCFLIQRPAAYDFPEIEASDFDELMSQPIDWIYFGTLLQTSDIAREMTREILASIPTARRFYDINLRAKSYTPELVNELMELAAVVKLNDVEVTQICSMFGSPSASLEKFCRDYADRFRLDAICVTRGHKGCALLLGDEFVEQPGYHVKVADAVGAGDAFAAALLHGLGAKWEAAQIADFANRVGALVASRSGAIPPWTLDEVSALDVQHYRLERA